MSSPEPAEPGTPLDLTAEPLAAETADAAPSTALELPSSLPPPQPAAEPSPVPTAPAPLGNLVVAHLRRVEIAMLGRVLVTTLAGALPPSMVRLERRRSLGRRLVGRDGAPTGITVLAGDRALTFRAPEVGVTETSISHTVGGVVLSTTRITVAEWLDELGRVLDQVTRHDEAARTALERALLSG